MADNTNTPTKDDSAQKAPRSALFMEFVKASGKATAWTGAALTAMGTAAYVEASKRVGHEEFATLNEAFSAMASPATIAVSIGSAIMFGAVMSQISLYNKNSGAPKP